MRKLQITRASIIYFGHALGGVAALLLPLQITRVLEKSAAGGVLYFLYVGLIVANLITAPLGMWLTRVSGDVHHTQERYLLQHLWLFTASVFLSVSLVFICVAGPSSVSLFISFVSSAIISSQCLYDWNSRNSYLLYATGIALNPIIKLVATLVAARGFTEPLAMECAITASSVLTAFVFMALSRLPWGILDPRNIKGVRWSIMRDGVALVACMGASSVVFSAYQAFDKTLLRIMWDDSLVAELALCVQWSYGAITMGFQPLVAIVYPKILQGSKNGTPLFFKNKFSLICLGAVALGALVYAFQAVVSLLVPDAYASIRPLLWVGMTSGLLFVFGQIASIYFSRPGAERGHLVSVLLPVLVTLPLMATLIKYLGTSGAIYANLCFCVLYASLCTTLVSRYSHDFRK